jgi:hypothetical protein
LSILERCLVECPVVHRCFGRTYCLHLQSRRISRQGISQQEVGTKQKQAFIASCFLIPTSLSFSLTLKMEAVRSSETSLNFYRSTRHHIPEDSTLRNHRCKNIKLTILGFVWRPFLGRALSMEAISFSLLF